MAARNGYCGDTGDPCKWRHCDWHGTLKTSPSKRITKLEYSTAFRRLDRLVIDRSLERFEHSPEQTLVTALVSPVNARYQIRRRTSKANRSAPPVKPPMGAADCMIIAAAVSLKRDLGGDLVVFATGDQRQCDVARRLRTTTFRTARDLGLDQIAQRLGWTWTPYIYPRALNLRQCSEEDLREALHTWPLPDQDWELHFDASSLKGEHQLELKLLWADVKREYRIGVDSLPYSVAIDDLRGRFARVTGQYLGNLEIYKALQGWRKAGKLKPSSS